MKNNFFDNEKRNIVIIVFLIGIIGFAIFNSFENNEEYILITGDTVTSPCTKLGGNGCTSILDNNDETLINDDGFCSSYSDNFYKYCVSCKEDYEWSRDSSNVIKGSCKKIQEII